MTENNINLEMIELVAPPINLDIAPFEPGKEPQPNLKINPPSTK